MVKSCYFKQKVYGNTGADHRGSYSFNPIGNFTAYNFNVTYQVYQIYGARDPSICHVFFYIQSPRVIYSIKIIKR